MIHCHISFPNPLTHLIHVELRFDNIQGNELDLILPYWRPGKYEKACFSKNILGFIVIDDNNEVLNYAKTKSNIWTIQTKNNSSLSIKYLYYANKMDAGNSVVNEELLYINFINCIMYTNTHENEPITLRLDIPRPYDVACTLARDYDNGFHADNYQQLVDAPLIACERLKKLEYKVNETLFSIVIMGNCPLSDQTLLADFKKFTQVQIDKMNGFPCSHYSFILLSLDYKHYHGVEHQNSTVLVLGPNDKSNGSYRENLIGVASHELFHAWNVTRIRPAEMSPYQFENETITDTGFITEGFTTYFGDLFLVQCGIFSQVEYFKEINKLLKRHFENYGRFENSLIASSRNLWVDGYQNIYPPKKVSIYVKGALCALILDVTIQSESKGKYSLIDAIKIMMERHGVEKGGYTKMQIYELLQELTNSLEDLLPSLYDSTDDLLPLLEKIVDEVGCELNQIEHPDPFTSRLGILYIDNKISAIAPNSLSASLLSVGDELITLNEKPFTSSVVSHTGPNHLVIKRNSKTINISIKSEKETYYYSYQIDKMRNATPTQLKKLSCWLGNN
jgi:predicted metalloprotease with PDZ domain